MGRCRLPWVLAVPLMVAGSMSAHESSYWLVAPDHGDRSRLLAATGHGYFQYLPLIVGVMGSLFLAGVVRRVVASRGSGDVPAWPFFLLPLVGFTLQEHLERLLHTGVFPLAAVLEPTFLVGLALQVPFALAAYVCARLLLNVVDRLRGVLSSAAPPVRRAPARVRPARAAMGQPRISGLALGYGERGPPLLVG
jgi:hypothetical protein